MPTSLSRMAAVLLTLLVLLAPLQAARALTPADLPPVDQVFQVSATAPSPDRIEVSFKIAKGFYLYRHQFKFTGDAAFTDARASIPAGKPHRDEFFGDVETYRDALTIPVSGIPSGDVTTLTVRYQGCADIGLCYPPTTKKLRIPLSSPAPVTTNLFGKPVLAVDQALPPEQAFQIAVTPRGDSHLRVTLIAVDGYYLYQRQIRVTSHSPDVRLGAPAWPRARMYDDPEFGHVPVYFGVQDIDIPLSSSRGGPARITVDFQGCKENGICYAPMKRSFDVTLPAVAAATSSSPGAVTNVTKVTTVTAPATSTVMVPGAETAPEVLAAQGLTTPRTPPPPAKRINTSMSAGLALLLALLGGLILNLMPCVLPVLSLKALSLAQGHETRRTSALAYTAGVLTCFLALGGLLLALRGAGDAVGWAFQMQQPLVIAALALLMFALGLSLSGVWHAGGRWLGFGQTLTEGSHWRSDFFTGLLAVIVATPCVAPFMGAAMAWAFFAPTWQALLVFLALGLGLALPFLLIGFFPGVARLLPRPGAWMETFKQFMAFPMYLSAIWLLWVLAQQRGSAAAAWCLVAALLVAFAAWAWTRAARVESRGLRIAAVLAALLVVFPLARVVAAPAVVASESSSFDPARIESLRASGSGVLVNITADWCITCKVNERAVLSTDEFRSLLSSSRTVYMVGDYTNVSDSITAYLKSFNAVGVPLYVYYPPTGDPVVLPTVLTRAIVRDALGAK